MNANQIATENLHNAANYEITTLDDEIRAERHCTALLKLFHQSLLHDLELDPLEAGTLAAGADYTLREFVIGHCRINIFAATATTIRQFAGNWYIVRNLEPNTEELKDMLAGTAAFYRYCTDLGLVSVNQAAEIAAACSQTADYQQRIEDFHNIAGNGFTAWNQACPLP